MVARLGLYHKKDKKSSILQRWYKNIHFLIEPVVDDERMGHLNTAWFDGMPWSVMVATNFLVVIIRNFACHFKIRGKIDLAG